MISNPVTRVPPRCSIGVGEWHNGTSPQKGRIQFGLHGFCPWGSRSLRILTVFLLLLSLAQKGWSSFEAKVILLDSPNKLMAIDRGSEQGLDRRMIFYIYRGTLLIGEATVIKTSRQVAICEINSLSKEADIRINAKFVFLTPEERSGLPAAQKISSGAKSPASTEVELKTEAHKIADAETTKRKLNAVLIKEKAKGIAEAVKSEKELEKIKEEAQAIVKEVIEEKKKEKRIVSFDFKDADIKNVVKIIAREANVNIVMPVDFPSLNITISLKDVEMENALEMVLGMANYAFFKEDNIYKIVKTEDAEKKTTYKTFAPRYIQADKLKTLLTDGGLISGDGKVVVDSRSNKIVVIDLPKNMIKIEEVIKQVDVKPRQVNIEAKIVDVSLTDTEKLGIDWTWVKPLAGAATADTVTAAFQAVTTGSVSEDKGLFKYGTLNAAEIAAVFEALMKREHANVLSKPTITTLNNIEAKINVTSKIPYQSGTTSTTTTSTTTTAVSWLEKEVGITLSVTPYISDAGDIIMKVETTASLLQGYTSDKISDRYPLIMSRSATTQVMVKDGETLVIGGLITQELRDTKTGIPVISDIPIVGIPFQKKSRSVVNTELIIFITPHIVPSQRGEQPKG